MPYTRLVKVLSVGPLNPGQNVTLPHGLSDQQGNSARPAIVRPDQLTPITAAAVTNTGITFQNDGDAPAKAEFYCEIEYTDQQTFAFPQVSHWKGTGVTTGIAPGNIEIHAAPSTSTLLKPGNSGLTALEPVTLEQAVSLLPPGWRGSARISFAKGDYELLGGTRLAFGHPIGAKATPLILLGAFETLISSTSATSDPEGRTLTVTGISPQPLDQYVGAFLTVTRSAGGAANRRMIRSNTSNTFEVNAPFGFQIVNGDTIAVEKPAVTIKYPNVLSFMPGGFLGLQGIRFQATSVSSAFRILTLNVLAEACEFDLGGGSLMDIAEFGALRAASEPGVWTAAGSLNPFSKDRAEAGCFIHDGNIEVRARSRVTQCFVFRNVKFRAQRSEVAFVSLDAKGSTFEAADASVLNHSSPRPAAAPVATVLDPVYHGRIDGAGAVLNPGSHALITYRNNSTGALLTELDVVNSPGNAINVEARSFASIGSLTGGNNVGYGVHVLGMSQARIDVARAPGDGTRPDTGRTEVTGKKGDTLLGTALRLSGFNIFLHRPNERSYDEIRGILGNWLDRRMHIRGVSDDFLNRIEP